MDNRNLRLPNIRSTLPTAIAIVITLLRTRKMVQRGYSTLLYGRLEVQNSTHMPPMNTTTRFDSH
ncbi:hypothetical protein BDD12DRAFT_858403, partial [Trichophaea hybrida]